MIKKYCEITDVFGAIIERLSKKYLTNGRPGSSYSTRGFKFIDKTGLYVLIKTKDHLSVRLRDDSNPPETTVTHLSRHWSLVLCYLANEEGPFAMSSHRILLDHMSTTSTAACTPTLSHKVGIPPQNQDSSCILASEWS